MNESAVAQASNQLRQQGIDTSYLVLDVTNPEDIERLSEQQLAKPVDVLIITQEFNTSPLLKIFLKTNGSF